MASPLTIREAFDTWEALMAPDLLPGEEDQPLLEACETLILTHPILDHNHASRLCSVFLTLGEVCGRSDELDQRAMARLQQWLADQSELREPTGQGLGESLAK